MAIGEKTMAAKEFERIRILLQVFMSFIPSQIVHKFDNIILLIRYPKVCSNWGARLLSWDSCLNKNIHCHCNVSFSSSDCSEAK